MKREISNITEGLNPAQKQAVEEFEGPSIIVAGAGSGKTKVLTTRIANILSHGHKAGSILALTFTNKASREMKERIASLVGSDKARYLWMGTFHSVFVRFLREDAQLIGFPSSFTIYDTTDSKSAIRNCVKELSLDEKLYKPGEVLSRISMAKNNLITPSAYLNNSSLIQADAAMRKPRIADIFALYEKRCKQSGAMDFDDILLYTNILLRDFPEVLDKLRNRFSYILVDEYQDTNYAQYLIVKKLSSLHRNICVVGDDAQSIYGFRGARIENILNFKKDYPEAKEFRLEQNYRSTQTIVKAANSLISKNSNRLNKECFSAADTGVPIEVTKAYTDQEEAFLTASSIVSTIHNHKAAYSEIAVLYRTNAQSRAIEEALRKRSVPYKIFGGKSFYERAEVKDIMAYFRLLVNPKDDEAFKRVINIPARSIGATSLARLTTAATNNGLSIWETIHQNPSDITSTITSTGINSSTAGRIIQFCQLISEIKEKALTVNAYDVAMEIFIQSGYSAMLKGESSVEAQARAENAEELFNSIKAFVEEREAEADLEPENTESIRQSVLLGDYLETISLMSALDNGNNEQDADSVSLMTVHSAKGLEFSYVYIIGLEENLFPSLNSSSSAEEIEEERRLMYVAITRAKKAVTISYAQTRFRWGSHVSYPPSRFIREIDQQYVNWPDMAAERGAPVHKTAVAAVRIQQQRPKFTPPKPPNPDFQADPVSKLKEGQQIEHDRFGFGKLLTIEGDPLNLRAIVEFKQGGRKVLLLKYAKLRIVE